MTAAIHPSAALSRHGMMRVLLPLLLLASPAWGQGYTDAMYRRALEDQTTAPLYVLVTLRDEATASERLFCVLAPFLLGAIHFEYGLGHDEAGIRRAFDIAAVQPGRRFSFTDERARSNFPPLYSPEALSALRQRLEPLSSLELGEQLSDPDSFLSAIQDYALLESRGQVNSPTYREPLAHVLLERGVLVGMTDVTGELYVAE